MGGWVGGWERRTFIMPSMGLVPVGIGPGAGLGALAGLPGAAAFFLMGLCREWVGGWVGKGTTHGTMYIHCLLSLPHPPTHPCITVAHSNRLLLLHPPTEGGWVGGRRTFFPVAINTSSAVTRPNSPVPFIVFKSNPASSASFLPRGVAAPGGER